MSPCLKITFLGLDKQIIVFFCLRTFLGTRTERGKNGKFQICQCDNFIDDVIFDWLTITISESYKNDK